MGCASCRWARARTGGWASRRGRPTSRAGQGFFGPLSNNLGEMGFADVWNKTLVYFGIAEEEDWDEDGYLTDEELQRAYADRPNVRRLAPRRRGRDEYSDDWTDPEPSTARTSVLRPPAQQREAPRRL